MADKISPQIWLYFRVFKYEVQWARGSYSTLKWEICKEPQAPLHTIVFNDTRDKSLEHSQTRHF